MRNKVIATGLVIGAGLAANAMPATAESGGVPVGYPNPGSVASGESSGSGGVAVEHVPKNPHLAATIRSIKRHMRRDTDIRSFTLDPHTLPAAADNDDVGIIVTSTNDYHARTEITNPLALLSADGSRVAAYAGREGDSLCVIPANRAEVTGYVGNVAVSVDVQDALTPHTLELAPDTGANTAGFIAEDGTPIGMMP